MYTCCQSSLKRTVVPLQGAWIRDLVPAVKQHVATHIFATGMVKYSSQAELMLASLACMWFFFLFFLLRSKMIEYTLDTINRVSLDC